MQPFTSPDFLKSKTKSGNVNWASGAVNVSRKCQQALTQKCLIITAEEFHLLRNMLLCLLVSLIKEGRGRFVTFLVTCRSDTLWWKFVLLYYWCKHWRLAFKLVFIFPDHFCVINVTCTPQYLPNIWRVPSSILFLGFTLLSGPKHSTSVPFSAGSEVPLNVDENKVELVP